MYVILLFMSKAARAIILDNNNLLVMHRNKHGSEYFTLVGGQVNDSETIEQALVREVKEETGLDVVNARLVYIEEHAPPYNEQYIFLCEIAAHQLVDIQPAAEEALMNRLGMNIHAPLWVNAHSFARLAFRTPDLQKAIITALDKGFPAQPVKL
jgi:ADP-ribose pyrophosphatase YjhB (NUDIX family)